MSEIEDQDNVDRELFKNVEKLRELRIAHRDLDEVISRLSLDFQTDQLQLKRLKKRKLILKDQITRPSVRYFAARDLLATQHLVEILGTFFARIPGQGPAYPVDLNESMPKPIPGRVEVWLPAVGAADSRSA